MFRLILIFFLCLGCDLSDPLVQICRGIILDSKANWKIVAFPFVKFFNFGEPRAQQLDWDSVRVRSETFLCSSGILLGVMASPSHPGTPFTPASFVPFCQLSDGLLVLIQKTRLLKKLMEAL